MASGASPQGKAHDEVTTQAFPGPVVWKCSQKLPDTTIWLPQKITPNYRIVPARAMNSSHNIIGILKIAHNR